MKAQLGKGKVSGSWVEVELTDENLDDVAFKSGRAKDELQGLLDRRHNKKTIQIWVFVKKEEGNG